MELESLISFGPKYLIKMIHCEKNVIQDRYILFKSALKMQEMAFQRLKF